MAARQNTASHPLKQAAARPGDKGWAHAQVADIQRARMLGAMVQEIAERGVANVSVAHVVARSGVSRRTFYEIFSDREDCFLAAFDEAIGGVAAVVAAAYEQPGSWLSKVRAALTVLLECLDNDRATGRLLIVDSLAAGPRSLERRQGVLAQIIPIVERGRSEGNSGVDPSSLAGEGIVGGVLSVLHARLTEGDRSVLVELASPLMGMIVLPYLGAAAARKEMARSTPERSVKRPTVRLDPLQELNIRLTYRTMRVLMAVASHPGSSNRTLADDAGIADQGQISKLLARLEGFGLIENKRGGPTRGEPNAWTLTQKGREVEGAIASQTTRS